MITLKQYTNEQNQILSLIQGFGKSIAIMPRVKRKHRKTFTTGRNRAMLSISSEMMKPMWALHIWEAAEGK